MPIGTTSEACTPASIVTFCVTLPRSLSSVTACSPGAISTIIGVFPSGVPSMLMRAPAGSVRTCSWPKVFTAFGSSRYCETSAPAAMVTGIVRDSPFARTTSEWVPAASASVRGALPRFSPSTSTSAPGGSVLTVIFPVVTGGVAAASR